MYRYLGRIFLAHFTVIFQVGLEGRYMMHFILCPCRSSISVHLSAQFDVRHGNLIYKYIVLLFELHGHLSLRFPPYARYNLHANCRRHRESSNSPLTFSGSWNLPSYSQWYQQKTYFCSRCREFSGRARRRLFGKLAPSRAAKNCGREGAVESQRM